MTGISVLHRSNVVLVIRVSMTVYWLILISNANAGCKLLHHDLSMQDHRGCPLAAIKHTTILTICSTQPPGPQHISRGTIPWSRLTSNSPRTPSRLLKSLLNPALREHTQTNKHSTEEHTVCNATALPRRASRHTRRRSAATAAVRPASDYRARRVQKGQKGQKGRTERTERTAPGMKARSALTARHLANKQRRCRWLRIGGCVMRWGSRRRMWPAPAGCWDPSPVRMCSVVADGLVVVVVSLV